MQMRSLTQGHRSRKRLPVCVTEVNELVVHVHMYKGHLSYKDTYIMLLSVALRKGFSVSETRSILFEPY